MRMSEFRTVDYISESAQMPRQRVGEITKTNSCHGLIHARMPYTLQWYMKM